MNGGQDSGEGCCCPDAVRQVGVIACGCTRSERARSGCRQRGQPRTRPCRRRALQAAPLQRGRPASRLAPHLCPSAWPRASSAPCPPARREAWQQASHCGDEPTNSRLRRRGCAALRRASLRHPHAPAAASPQQRQRLPEQRRWRGAAGRGAPRPHLALLHRPSLLVLDLLQRLALPGRLALLVCGAQRRWRQSS